MKAKRSVSEFLAPVIEAANKPGLQPLAFVIDPGKDWPDDVEPLSGKSVLLPKLDLLKKLVPEETFREVEDYAHKIVRQMGLPEDATVADIKAGKYDIKPPLALDEGSNPDKSESAKPAKRSGWGKSMLGSAALAAGIGLAGAGTLSQSTNLSNPPTAVSPLEAAAVDSRSRKHGAKERKGLTLVEVLVVIGIIGVLLAITIPAVQQARDSAREMQWKNNMRQVGVALHSFESAHGHLPNSVTYQRNPNVRPTADNFTDGNMIPHNWVVDILPFIEQDALAQQYDKSKRPADQNETVKKAKLSVMQHPSFQDEEGRIHMAAFSSSGISATDPAAVQAQDGIKKDYLLTQQPGVFNTGLPPQWVMNEQGKWTQHSAQRFAGFRDGTSNTPIIGTHGHEDGSRDPWLSGGTHVTGLWYGTELGQSRVNAGLMGNVTLPGNVMVGHTIGHEGDIHPDRYTALFADGHVARVAATGAKGASWFNEGAKAWEEKVNINDGKSPNDDLAR